MSQIVEVPGYGQVEFPDGMADKDIELAIRKNMLRKDAPTAQERFVASPIARFALGAAQPVAGVAQMVAEPFMPGDENPVTRNLREIERMKQAGGHEGADLAGIAGGIIGPMGVLSKVPVAASVGGRIAQGAGIGAGMAVAHPVLEGSVFGAKPGQAAGGAAVGAAIPAATEVVRGVSGLARNILDPYLPGGADRIGGKIANAAAGDKRAQVLAELQANRQMVPGSQAASGEVSAPAGSAEFAGLQRIVEKIRPSEYVTQGKAQDAARLAAVRSVGRDKAALDAAEAARTANAATNYSQAYQQAVKADPELALIGSNPFFKEALPDALRLAQAEGINPKTDTTRFLHLVKLSLDKRLEPTAQNALGETEKRAVGRIKDRLVSWIAKRNPAYDRARDQFAKDSVPINRMEVGQFLEGKLTSPVETGKQRASAYASALREAPRTLKQSTGFKGNQELSDVLTPQQVQSVTGVADDLARRAQYEQLAQAGTERAKDIITDMLPGLPASGMFSPAYSVARAIVRRLSGTASQKTLEALAVKMQDPVEMAKVMQALPAPIKAQVLRDVMDQTNRAAIVGATQ